MAAYSYVDAVNLRIATQNYIFQDVIPELRRIGQGDLFT